MSRDDFCFSHRLRVRWAEVDSQGIVFNAHYLTYFDVAATEYWRSIGWAYPAEFLARGVDTFAVKSTVEYHAPATFDDEIDVLVRIARLGRTSMRVSLEIHREETHLVTGELVYVTASPTNRKPMPIPDGMREAIRRFERKAPEES